MDRDRPLATIRIAAHGLDRDTVTRMLLGEDFYPARAGALTVVAGSPGRRRGPAAKQRVSQWMATTENVTSTDARFHLDKIVGLVSGKLAHLRDEMPDLDLRFSLLSFDPDFTVDSMQSLILAATGMGELVIELPAAGKEIFLSAHSSEEVAA